MGRNKGPYVIGSRTFRTQRALIDHVRSILRRTPCGSVLEGNDQAFVLALLKHHPRAAEKIGPGIRAIRVEPNGVWGGTPMFVAVRIDGTETDFSYMKCIRAPSKLDRFRAGCRRAVFEDILAFKQHYFDRYADDANRVICPLTGKRLGWHEVHVDHAPPWPFRLIVDAFIERHSIRLGNVMILGAADGEVEPRFADRDLAGQFRNFHAEKARLRIIAAKENLRTARQCVTNS